MILLQNNGRFKIHALWQNDANTYKFENTYTQREEKTLKETCTSYQKRHWETSLGEGNTHVLLWGRGLTSGAASDTSSGGPAGRREPPKPGPQRSHQRRKRELASLHVTRDAPATDVRPGGGGALPEGPLLSPGSASVSGAGAGRGALSFLAVPRL